MNIILKGVIPMVEPCGQCDRQCGSKCKECLPNRSCSPFIRG